MIKMGKLEEVKEQMKKAKLDILGAGELTQMGKKW